MTAPRITIITFAWPPRNSIGAHRPYSWAKYWSAAGAQVRVITARKYAYDEPLDLVLPPLPGVEVIETDYASGAGLLARLIHKSPLKRIARTVFRALRGKAPGVRNPREGWLKAALAQAADWARDCDYVISTYDPRMVHQIAAAMKVANPKLHWIADYRDLWSLNHVPGWSDAQRAEEHRIEQETVGRHASLVSSVSEDLARQQGEFLGIPWISVTNGFDIDEDALRAAIMRPRSSSQFPLRVVYTGKIYPGLRDPSPLFEAIADMEDRQTIEKGAIEVHIYGGQTEGIEPMLGNARFAHFVKTHGHVAREVALKAQQEADLLLLLESPLPEAKGVLTGKIFEYMATGAPILSLGSRRDSAIGEMLDRTRTGICTEDDKTLIEGVLSERISEATHAWFDPQIDKIMTFSRENQANYLLENILSQS